MSAVTLLGLAVGSLSGALVVLLLTSRRAVPCRDAVLAAFRVGVAVGMHAARRAAGSADEVTAARLERYSRELTSDPRRLDAVHDAILAGDERAALALLDGLRDAW